MREGRAVTPVSHDDLRHVETRLQQAIDNERTERIASDVAIETKVTIQVGAIHGTLEKLNDTAQKMSTDVAFMKGKLTGTKVTAMEMLKGAGWVITAVLLGIEALKRR